MKVVRASEAKVRKISEVKLAENLITKEISPHFSLAVTESQDGYVEEQVAEYERIYYILSGEMVIEQENTITLRPGDSCHITPGEKYTLKGKFRAIVVNHPSFGVKG